MELIVCDDAAALARRAADAIVERVRATPALAMAVPAGRTPRRMYAELAARHRQGHADFSAMRVFAVDELCPPAPPEGYFWRQVRSEFLSWAGFRSSNARAFTSKSRTSR